MHVAQVAVTDREWVAVPIMHVITCCNPSVMYYDAPAIILLYLLAREGAVPP